MRASRLTSFAVLLALLGAVLMTLATVQIGRMTRLLESVEHWTADWRTALLADRAATQHPNIAVVLVDDDAIAGLPYRSPIDRGLLARLVQLLDRAGAKVIALDFLFDQPTEAAKDRQLIEALRKASPKVVLGTIDDRVPSSTARRAYAADFVATVGAPSGYLNLKYELDGVIRGEAEASMAIPGPTPPDNFAAAIARVAGAKVAPPAARISWLKPPIDGSDTFMTIPAAQLLLPANDMERRLAQMLLDGLAGRVVLVGGDLSGSNDRHPASLSKLLGEPLPGVVIHAHAVAQHLDGRRLTALDPALVAILAFVLSFTGFLAGWAFRSSSWITVTLPIVLLALLGAVMLGGNRTILPFAGPALAWSASALVGRFVGWLLHRPRVYWYEAS